tara:strand:- start:233 stop:838 length:606 start_codon:yes stop_codon:yes gene_type:complete
MATYRKLHTTFWTDPFVENLTQEQKLFYLYLITNTKTKQSGIYEITKRYMAFETGFSIKEITELITHFVNDGKILYSEITNEIAIVNWVKHNFSFSHSVLKCIETDLYEVKDKQLIKTMYDKKYIDTLLGVPKDKQYTSLIDYLMSIHIVDTEYIETVDSEMQQEQEQEQEETEVQVDSQESTQGQLQELAKLKLQELKLM